MSIAEADRQLTAEGQMFEVVEAEIRALRYRVWKICPPTLGDILRTSRSHGDRPFLVFEDERLTFEEHFRTAAHLAHVMRDRFGVVKGDRVAIAMRNLPEWSLAFWAAAAAGAVVVPLNAWWTGEELEYGLADSGTKVVFTDFQRQERLGEHWGKLPKVEAVIVARAADRALSAEHLRFEEVVADVAEDEDLPEVAIDADDDATIFYTSGTTGGPKGALGTHRNICTNPIGLMYVAVRQAFRAGVTPSGGGEPTSYLISVPFFHATGCHSILVTNILAGGKLVMMHRWDAGRALELIERERVSTFGGVPAMVMQVLDHPDFDTRDTASVKNIGYGGAPAPPDLVRRIAEHFPTGKASNGYGLTETSSLSTMNQEDDYVAKPDTVGPPMPVVDMKVVGPSGEELPVGEV
ncbi:MAG: AMP-binding protein, partial [Acidimicrobiales bacterium]